MKPLRILLVEDCPTDGRKLVEDLIARDCDVVLECDGIAAIERVYRTREPFDLICLDIQADLAAAQYTAAVLRAIDYQGPIVTLAPCSQPRSCPQCFDSGFTGCVSRKTAPDEIVAFLEISRAGPPALSKPVVYLPEIR